MSPMAADYSLTRNYIEWLADFAPWAKTGRRNRNHEEARILDADHYGLEKVKDRILDYLSVRQLKLNMKARFCASSDLRAWGKLRWANRSRAPWDSSCSSFYRRGTRRKSADIAAPTSGHCRARSSGTASPGETRSGFASTKSIKWGATSAVIPLTLARSIDPNKIPASATTISTSLSICRRCCSSPPRICSILSRSHCATAWRSLNCRATAKKKKCTLRSAT